MRIRGYVVSVLFVLALVAGSVAGFVFGGLRPLLGLDLVGGVSVILQAPPGTDSDVVDRALETVRERVDVAGVAEPDITRQGETNIQVQIPLFEGQTEAQNTERLLRLIGTTARLEFRAVRDVIPPGTNKYEKAEVTKGDPEDQEVVFLGADDRTKYRLGPVEMTGDVITDAQARPPDPASTDPATAAAWFVAFELNSEGAQQFADLTRELTNRQLAIILDQRVESAPTVNEAITGGRGTITGDFTEQEARDLAVALKTGALPVELTTLQAETVSPTLGKESLRTGIIAGIAGLIALCLYLAFYYRLLGVVTWLGMAIWGILALAIVSLLGRTVGYALTLAGVAGLVVSLGIAADSYIVFYERLKDEVRKGKTVRVAVGPAFRGAWRTILAANLVAILGAVVLYLLAIGAVRGFALTLGISTALDIFVVYFFKRPAVFLIARSRRLSELRGMGLRSGVAADPMPQAVRGGSR
jgi:preprotein translocase subunit SecD